MLAEVVVEFIIQVQEVLVEQGEVAVLHLMLLEQRVRQIQVAVAVLVLD
jgi:hypothetical protein